MDARDLKAYAERDWTALETMKQEHWAREFKERGSEATLDASLVLWQHMRLINPEWPSRDERDEDLAHHVALKRAIDRAACAFVSLAAR